MEKETKVLKPSQGIIVFLLVIIMILFVAAPIQMKLGMYGVLLTEVLILLFGVVPALLLKADLKEVIPIKIPKVRQIAGVVIMWLGSFLLVMLVTLIIGYFFPEGLTAVSNALQDTFTSIPMGVAFLIIAVSPAICEEVLVRGFVQASLRPLNNKWLIITIVGVLFGIFHLDPYRFFPTAILGFVLSYIMYETKNILLPAIFHFVNNGLSTITSFATSTTDSTQSSFNVPLESIGAYMIIAAVVPFLLLWGSRLLKVRSEQSMEQMEVVKTQNKKTIKLALLFTVILFVVGVLITALAVA
jgi:membrane protease YdiL (CAAX protease family)